MPISYGPYRRAVEEGIVCLELTAFLLGVAYVLAALNAKGLTEGWLAIVRRSATREKLDSAAILKYI